MKQQKIYELCMSYGAGIEAYIAQCIEDKRNGESGSDDAFYCQLLLLSAELKSVGVEIDEEADRKYIRERIDKG